MGNEIEIKKKNRLIFIDVLRGVAVLWMIETHVVDVCLWHDFKQGFFYNMLNISNGFVAVTFLFCAGAGFWLAAEKKTWDFKHFKAPLWVYLRRLGFILILAFYMHLPVFSFSKLFAMTPAQMAIFFQNDILQTIVYSSFIALIFLMLSPKNIIFKYLSIVLALFFILLAPYIYYINPFEKLPYIMAFWVSFPPVSKFPLFPWAGYFFAGVALTAFFMDSKNRDKFAKIVFITSIILPVLILLSRDTNIAFFNMEQWWKISPFHTLFRICGSTFGFSGLFLLEKYFNEKKYINFLVISGRES
ncbi:MAG: heparan-alpha-glucosaminide N-acetyltransferase domain-containing protein, partial [Candidatus Gastranaerophilaceae bacterium]